MYLRVVHIGEHIDQPRSSIPHQPLATGQVSSPGASLGLAWTHRRQPRSQLVTSCTPNKLVAPCFTVVCGHHHVHCLACMHVFPGRPSIFKYFEQVAALNAASTIIHANPWSPTLEHPQFYGPIPPASFATGAVQQDIQQQQY